MGEEFFYCWKCQTRLAGADFERGRAFQIRDKISCADCVMDLVAPLPIKEQEAVLMMVKEARERALRPPSRSAIPAHSSAAVPAGPARIHPFVYKEQKTHPLVMTLFILVLAFAAGAIIYIVKDESPHPAPPAEKTDARPRPPESVRPPSASTPEAAAQETLRKADDFARANPADLKGQEARYRDAVKACEGTPSLAEARSRLEEVRRKVADTFAADLATLDQQARASCAKEDFKAAVDLLEQARKRHPDTAWTTAIDQRILQVNQEAWKVFIPLRDKAVDAQKRGAKDEAQAAVDRVMRWGLAALITDLEKALAPPRVPVETTPAPPPATETRPSGPEASAYLKLWEAAAAVMASHDFGRAGQELEESARPITDAAVREEIASDLENFRRAADLHRDALLAASRWPKGQKLRLAFLDENAEKAEIEGPVHRADALAVEIARDRRIVSIPLHEALPGSLIEALKRSNADAPVDPRAAVTLCLLEGDLDGARAAAGDPPYKAPEKYASFARKAAEARPKSAPARKLFWAAEQEFRSAGTRGRAIEKISTLLSEHAATPLVRRNRALLTARAEAARDFFYLPGDITSAGVFTMSQYPKVDLCWTVESDVPAAKAKNTFVEFEFYALPETAYRCWLHVGGCCAETFTFYAQVTDLAGMEPGGDAASLVKHGIVFLKKYHVQHGGVKEPSRWEWAPLQLPKFATAGIKKVRLISDQQGFSVAHAVVSSTRQNFPREQEVKEIEKAAAAERAGALAPTDAPAPVAPPPERTWKPLFDGRTTDGLTRDSAPAWRVEDGSLVPAPGGGLPGETREAFAEGEVRIRFEVQGLEGLFFKFLQGPDGFYRISFDEAQLRTLEGKPRDLMFSCRRDAVTAELDGRTVALAKTGQPVKGTLQFGAAGKRLRILAIEQR
jgi:hypothetical protein